MTPFVPVIIGFLSVTTAAYSTLLMPMYDYESMSSRKDLKPYFELELLGGDTPKWSSGEQLRDLAAGGDEMKQEEDQAEEAVKTTMKNELEGRTNSEDNVDFDAKIEDKRGFGDKRNTEEKRGFGDKKRTSEGKRGFWDKRNLETKRGFGDKRSPGLNRGFEGEKNLPDKRGFGDKRTFEIPHFQGISNKRDFRVHHKGLSNKRIFEDLKGFGIDGISDRKRYEDKGDTKAKLGEDISKSILQGKKVFEDEFGISMNRNSSDKKYLETLYEKLLDKVRLEDERNSKTQIEGDSNKRNLEDRINFETQFEENFSKRDFEQTQFEEFPSRKTFRNKRVLRRSFGRWLPVLLLQLDRQATPAPGQPPVRSSLQRPSEKIRSLLSITRPLAGRFLIRPRESLTTKC
ncbi:uncharacterized protein LOC143032554 [Oratosquilla oratoria]|uniref:uncharacterized protein LOC143032554 n=1 Tax=Oratosquilla oratoria TaxID=337810 RepID=UPI003F764170